MLALNELRLLREVRIKLQVIVTISGFSSRMSKLRILDLSHCQQLRSCPGVGGVVGLEELLYSGCWELEEPLSLRRLTMLQILIINDGPLRHVRSLNNLPNCGKLTKINKVVIDDPPVTKLIPGVTFNGAGLSLMRNEDVA